MTLVAHTFEGSPPRTSAPAGAVTAGDAARQAGVAPATIRDWARHDRIRAVGRDRRGRPLYDLLQVLDVEVATRRSGRGRPRSA